MTTANPLLAQGSLPAFSTVRAEHVAPAVDTAIAEHKAAMAACVAATSFEAVLLAKEHADAALSRVKQTFSHLIHVANTPDLRAAQQAVQPLLTAYSTSVNQDAALFAALRAISRDGLSRAETRAIDLALRNFELAGVALPPERRARFAAVRTELARLGSEFSNAVMDATQGWTLPVADAARLAGIPAATCAGFAERARAKGTSGWLIDLHAPSVRAVLAYADDRDLRRTIHEASTTKASDIGPDDGRFDNSGRMVEILALRAEAARLLGFDTPVAWSLARKMARDADEVQAFLMDLAACARPHAQEELAALRSFAAETLGLPDLRPWDLAYVSEKLRTERHGIDQESIRRYLPLSTVLDGLFELLGALFGIELREVRDVDRWHPDVRHFTLHRAGEDDAFAAIYCDFFARSGKNGGAWMDVCRPRLAGAGFRQIPVAHLVCNFAGPVDGRPVHITHDEMTTLFHEIGHCLHHVLTEVDLPSVGGIASVEWDAIELPSQFMENFAWDPAMLRRVSAHADTGSPLPDAIIDRMLDARRFLGALHLIRQIEYAVFDIRLHLAAAQTAPVAVMAIYRAVRDEIGVMPTAVYDRFPHAFGHIFAGGYAAGYYGYLWAERLSADAFEPFADDGADRAALGRRFRDHVLARGATHTALENFTGFRGRAPLSDALLRRHGLAA